MCIDGNTLDQLPEDGNLTQLRVIAIDSPTIDSIVKGLETSLINTFPADSPRCAVDNIVDSFHGCF